MAAYANPSTLLGGGTATLTCTVKDSVATAWGESESLVLRDQADSDFFGWYAAELRPVVYDRLRELLTEEWLRRGYRVEFVNTVSGLPLEDGVTEQDVWDVWDAAASRLDVADLVSAAGLNSAYAAWH